MSTAALLADGRTSTDWAVMPRRQNAFVVSRYFRRRWDESRGDDFESWGYATYYFEAAEDGWPVRQVEVYDSGPVLRYGPAHQEDRFGGLGHARLDEFEDWTEWEITADEFERQWTGV